MGTTTQKWLLGCGCGCGVLALGILALFAAGFFAVRGVVEEFEELETGLDTVIARHGRVTDFRPWADGTIPAARLEGFLTVRQSTAESRQQLERALEGLGAGSRGEIGSLRDVFGILRSGASLLPRVADYVNARSQALLAAEMGLGEYLYLYAVAFYGGLGKSPADGPPFDLVLDEDEAGTTSGNESDVRARRDERVRSTLHDQLLPMLRHQLEDWSATGAVESEPWRRSLADEIAALEREPQRLPWADGLPPQLAGSLAPYLERLEASYSAPCNVVEVAPHR